MGPDHHALTSTQPAWADERSTLFSSPAWFEQWFEAFGATEHGQWSPAGQTSSYRIPYRMGVSRVGPIGLRVAHGAANSYTPQFDAVGKGAPSVADLRKMMKDLGVSVLVLPLLSRNSKLASAFDAVRFPAGLFLDFCEAAPVIDTSGSWDAYLQTRRKSRRSEWSEKERRLLKAGCRLEVLASFVDVASVFDEILAVEASGWKALKGTSIRQVPKARAFYEGMTRELAAAGKLRIFLIRCEDRIIAFKLCTLHGGRLCSLKTGYLEEFAKDSPGAVLQLWVSKWCFDHPDVQVFDLLGPATSSKLLWSTSTEPLYTLYVFRPTITGIIGWLRWSAGPRVLHWWRRKRGNVAAKQVQESPQQSVAET